MTRWLTTKKRATTRHPRRHLAPLTIALLLALLISPLLAVPRADAAVGGPIVLMGIDAEDGGVGGHGPITNYVAVVNSILGSVSNGGNGILVFGANGSNPRNFWNAIDAAIAGHPVTYVSGASNINAQSFTGFAMIAVVSDYTNTAGGLTPQENSALGARKADVAAFVNNGGGLLGFSSASFGPAAYPYLADLGSFTFGSSGYSNINPTPDGTAIGVTNALDVCCWHDVYLTFPSFLKVLATDPSGRAAAIGGGNVVISDIQLAPASATGDTGTSHTVTATVKENNTTAVGKTVTFTVLTGPHAGTTGTGVTNGSGAATFSYTGTASGTDTIEASFVDSAGKAQTSNRVAMEWLQTNIPPVVNGGGPYAGYEGSPVALDGTVTDADNDPLTYSWTYVLGPDVDAGATCAFSDPAAVDLTVTCTDDGMYYVILTASDGANPPVTDSTPVMILSNVAPTLGPISAPLAPVVVNTAIGASASFTDPGSNDTHSATWEWGDGSTSAGAVNAGTASGSHTYTAAGVYTVKLTVTDDDGGADTEQFQYVVVYDPAAGFVTGGGWINSPAGAYTADPSLSGKANFGFVSKYHKGATVPTGQTQFQFHAAGLNFHSASYEWLVIAGAKAQYKGSGTINGGGDYGFMLTATDGQQNGGGGADKFRIKIWDKATGAVVYDNQLGAADDADPATVLGGGSIVIHK